MWLAQSHRALECPLMPPRLCIKLIKNRWKRLRTLSRQKMSPHMLGYDRLRPLSPTTSFSAAKMKQSRMVATKVSRRKWRVIRQYVHRKNLLKSKGALLYPFVEESHCPRDWRLKIWERKTEECPEDTIEEIAVTICVKKEAKHKVHVSSNDQVVQGVKSNAKTWIENVVKTNLLL